MGFAVLLLAFSEKQYVMRSPRPVSRFTFDMVTGQPRSAAIAALTTRAAISHFFRIVVL
jgi:hypothetical protein